MTIPSIFIGCPNMGNVRTELAQIIFAWMTSPKYKTMFYPLQGAHPVDRARNIIFNEFLKSGFDCLFFIDSDMTCPPDTLDRLLAHNVDIVSAVALSWFQSKEHGIYLPMPQATHNNKLVYGQGLVRVHRTGINCTLISRNLAETIGPGNFYYLWKNPEKTEMFGSEDYVFCDHVRDAGFDIFVDFNILTSHFKTVDLAEIQRTINYIAFPPKRKRAVVHAEFIRSVFLDGKRFHSCVDVGAGGGAYAPLLRDYCDHIAGIDVLEQPGVRDLYDAFYTDPVEPQHLQHAHLVCMMDIIEHLTHEDGERLIRQIPGHILLSTPETFHPNDGAIVAQDNQAQAHLSLWTRDELEDLGFFVYRLSNLDFEKEYGKQLIAYRGQIDETGEYLYKTQTPGHCSSCTCAKCTCPA